jgi:uncharacterized protein involved in tolerance to divalent cations
LRDGYFEGIYDTINEHLLTNAFKKAGLKSGVLLKNKMVACFYLENKSDHFYRNSKILTEDYDKGIQAKYSSVTNMEMVEENIAIRSYTSVSVQGHPIEMRN